MSFPTHQSPLHQLMRDAEILKRTLQGNIFKVHNNDGSPGVLKMAWLQLIHAKRSWNNTLVEEDFLNECKVLLYLNQFIDRPRAILHAQQEYEWKDADGKVKAHCLLTEYVRGQELFDEAQQFWDKYRRKPNGTNYWFWHEKSQCIFRQLVSAVHWMHGKGVVHLDLSPENILVQEVYDEETRTMTTQIRIIDFGVSLRCDHGDFMVNGIRGKTVYMAPEISSGEMYDGRMADVWSIGATLLFMLVGVYLESEPLEWAMSNSICELLEAWGKKKNISEDACDVLRRVYRPVEERITMEELAAHPFVCEETAGAVCDDETVVFDASELAGATFSPGQLLDDDFCLNSQITTEDCAVEKDFRNLSVN